MTWPRMLARAGLVAAAGLLALGPASPAQAHAVLLSSEPADGAVVAEAPRAVRLWFSEDIAPRLSTARLVGADGGAVEGTGVAAGRGDRRVLTLDLPALAAGSYAVTWRVLAEDDGHPTSGVLVFSVQRATQAGAAATDDRTGTRPLGVAWRWLHLSLLAGLIGGFAVAGAVLRRAIPAAATGPLAATLRRAERRVLTVAAICGGLGAVAGLVDLAVRSAAGPCLALLLETRWGRLSLASEGILCALAAVAFALAATADRPRSRKTRTLWTIAGALVVATVSVEALRSHAAGLDSPRALAVAAAAVHILAACVWLGAVGALAALVCRSRDGAGRAALFSACRAPFTRMVLLSAGVVAATGLYHAGRQVASAGELVSTGYGRALLVKGALVLATLMLGLVNGGLPHRAAALRRSSTSTPGPFSSPRILVAEVAMGLLVLLAAGVLAETAPGRVPAAVPATRATGSGSVDDLVVTISVTPNQPGVNGVTVLAASARRPPPAQIDAVAVEVAGGTTTRTVPLRQATTGRYIGSAEIAAAGSTRLTAVISRGGDRLAVPVEVSVAAGSAAEPARGPSLASFVEPAAVLILVVVVLTAAWWFVLSRWRWRLDLDALDESP